MKHPTGVRRLDEALGGGLPDHGAYLVHGPPFVGKEVFARQFILTGLRAGTPAILVLTDASAHEVHKRLSAMDAGFDRYVKAGLVRFIDAYSQTIGAGVQHPATDQVDGLLNFNAVTAAVNAAQRTLLRNHPAHRLLFDSVSTLVAYTNAQTAFRFLQVLVGRSRAAGATSLLLLERGMHTDEEVQTVKHLTNGVIEFKAEAGRNLMRLEGLGATASWIEYRFNESNVEITGSLSAGRIA